MTNLEHVPRSGAGWRACALAVGALGLLLFGAAAQAEAQTAGLPRGTLSDQAKSGSIGPGKIIEAPLSSASYVPSPAQIAAHEQLLALKSQHAAPPLGPHTTALQVAAAGGPPTDPTVKQAATDFTVFKNSVINSTCSGCAQSTVNEPSTANSGKNIIAISNWNIAYALNGGAGTITWQNQDPYTLSSGYCCDQIILYNADRDVFVMLLLDYAGEGASTNGLTISTARGTAPTSWCTYKFTGASFGEGATDTLDYPKITISNNNLYLTWNDYPPNAGFSASGLARMPLDSLASCTAVNFNYLSRTDVFTLALTQAGAHDQFYWVSNWFLDGTVNGSNMRIFHWADNSGTYFYNTVGINAFNFTIASCNWCGRLDPRSESVVITPAEYRAQANSAFAGDQILEVAGSVGPSSFSGGQNYVVYNYFKLNSLAYIGSDATFNTGFPFAYPSCSVNAKGYVGCAMVQGTNPGGLILLQDNVSPTQPWGFDFVLAGASSNSSWGDYTWTNPWVPGGGPFETVLWNVAATGVVHPHYIVWGRGSDANDYSRWKAK